MKKISKISGIIFLMIGVVWLSSIYARCHGYSSRKAVEISLALEKEEARAQGGQRSPTIALKDLPIREFLSAEAIVFFWVIAYVELACATFFLLTGFFLLRDCSFKWFFVVAMIISDVTLKMLIVIYHWGIISPLRDIFRETNLLVAHFVPDKTFASTVSSYLTGVKLIQSGAIYYALGYIAFWATLLLLFIRSRNKSGINKS